MSIFLLHADTTGTDSIQDVIDAKKIEYIPIPNFQVYERVCLDLLKTVGVNDTIILDTTSQMGHIVRGDIKLGIDPETEHWESRQKYLGDKDNWGTYTAAANLIMRKLKNLYNRGASIITTSHEEERVDAADLRKKHNVGLNNEFRNMLDHCKFGHLPPVRAHHEPDRPPDGAGHARARYAPVADSAFRRNLRQAASPHRKNACPARGGHRSD